MSAVEVENRGRCFLDRTTRDVDDRPHPLGEKTPRRGDLLRDRDPVDVFGLCVRVKRQQPVLADLDDPVGRGDQSDNQRVAQIREPAGQWNMRHERDVGGLVAAVGEVDARRRLRRAAHADEHDVGVLEIFRQLAVVAHHREIQGVDALEVVGVQHVLRAGARCRILPQVGFEQVQDRPQNAETRRPGVFAAFLEPSREFRNRPG